VPAVFNERWAHDATIFYTFETLGVLDKLHRPFFDAIHRDRLRTDSMPALNAWLEKQGVDAKKFDATARSFGVQSKVKRAIRLTSDYKIEGTPAMAVHGRYSIGASDTMLDTVNQLVASVRKNKP
jgi:thiol:disulfide interchange protein DsbA